MKKLVFVCAAALALSGLAASAAESKDRQNAKVELSLTNEEGRNIELNELPQIERQRVTTLRNSLQQWGNQQSQRVTIIIDCKSLRPLDCTVTIRF